MTTLITRPLKFLHPTTTFRELVLLDAIEREPRLTQSKLAQSAGIVPAMVNNYIKEFIRSGFLSVEGNNRAMKYTLTPQGRQHKFGLFISYFRETISLYKNVKQEIQRKLLAMMAEGIEKVVLYGAAETAEVTLNAAEEIHLRVIGIVDGDARKQGREFLGRQIRTPQDIETLKPDAVVIASSGYQDELYQQLRRYETIGIRIKKL